MTKNIETSRPLIARPPLRLLHIDGIDQLRATAARWDDLWLRSEVTLPTARAEFVAQWVEKFAKAGSFHAAIVEDRQGTLVAALPMVYRRLGGVIPVAANVSNGWSSAGELLLDPSVDSDAVLDVLLGAVVELPRQLLWLGGVTIDAPHWEAFAEAARRAGLSVELRRHFQVALIEIGDDWEARKQGWAKNHRKKLAKHVRQLEERGELRLAVWPRLAVGEVESKLRRAFELEDRGWKGRAGTSVLHVPGMFDFFLGQARLLAGSGELELSFLELAGRPIAFSYAMAAKGVHHSFKIGYDPEFAAFGPGQLLRYFLMERFHNDPACHAMDCAGPLGAGQLRWKPLFYTTGRVVVAPRRLMGRVLLYAYKHWWPYLSRFRKRPGLTLQTTRSVDIKSKA